MTSFLGELKRRNVVRVAIAYAVVAWLLLQVADVVLDNIDAPAWVFQAILLLLVIGFPVAIIFAWAFELTPDGIKKEKDVDRSESITHTTGRKLDFIIIGVLVVAVGFLLADKLILDEEDAAAEEIIATEHKSIAVLPFVNMSDDADHFADGLSEELMNLLAKNPDLKVAGRTSSFAFKGRTPNFREIGAALGVEHVLEGSVRKSGNQLRVTAQLVKVKDGFHVWSDTYDRQMDDIFLIQDEVAGAITTELQLRLMPASIRPTENIDAYVLYLEALANSDLANESHLEAIDLLDQAIALDPTFAKAHEMRAMAYWFTGPNAQDSRVAQKLVYESATRALELDPTLVLARPFAISAQSGGAHWTNYMDVIEEAVADEPENTRLLYIFYWDLVATGYFEEALQYARRISALEPLSTTGEFAIASVQRALGRRQAARNAFQRNGDFCDVAWDYFHAGEFESAIFAREKCLTSTGGDPSSVSSFVKGVLDPDQGQAILDEFVDDAIAESDPANPQEAMYAAGWYLAFGYVDEYWEVIDSYKSDTLGPWRWGYEMRFEGNVWGGSKFRQHTHYITQEKIDLWDKRGPPDFCSKSSGQWVCE